MVVSKSISSSRKSLLPVLLPHFSHTFPSPILARFAVLWETSGLGCGEGFEVPGLGAGGVVGSSGVGIWGIFEALKGWCTWWVMAGSTMGEGERIKKGFVWEVSLGQLYSCHVYEVGIG